MSIRPETIFDPAALAPEPGWSEYRWPRSSRLGVTFASGDRPGNPLKMRMYRNDADGTLRAKVWFGPDAEGPPGFVHGGAVATVLDEALAAAAWLSDHHCVVGSINVEFVRPTYVCTLSIVHARVSRVEGNKVYAQGELRDPDGTVTARGGAMCVTLGRDRFNEMLRQKELK